MRVLLLSPYPELIAAPILASEDELICRNTPPSELDISADQIIISFGYRHILDPVILTLIERPVVNIHISYLPWNRGADPNFWSWFDNTPKGVSIHYIDVGIDSGPVLVQSRVEFVEPQKETLATTYETLRKQAIDLFTDHWKPIRSGGISATPQQGGSYHARKDKAYWWSLLPDGYNTPVTRVMEMGAHRNR